MKRKRTDWSHSAPRAPAAPALRPEAVDDPWAGEDVSWLEEEPARPWLAEEAQQNVPAVSFLRVVLVCALLGALLWALAGYGLFRLIAG
jgi:hypothetical protein